MTPLVSDLFQNVHNVYVSPTSIVNFYKVNFINNEFGILKRVCVTPILRFLLSNSFSCLYIIYFTKGYLQNSFSFSNQVL